MCTDLLDQKLASHVGYPCVGDPIKIRGRGACVLLDTSIKISVSLMGVCISIAFKLHIYIVHLGYVFLPSHISC